MPPKRFKRLQMEVDSNESIEEYLLKRKNRFPTQNKETTPKEDVKETTPKEETSSSPFHNTKEREERKVKKKRIIEPRLKKSLLSKLFKEETP